MYNIPDQQTLFKVPKLYETEDVPSKDKIIHLHFFFRGCDWYCAEYNGEDTFFGFVILNDDYELAEWGLISFEELKTLKFGGMEIETDLFWTPCKASEIDKICKCMGWYATA